MIRRLHVLLFVPALLLGQGASPTKSIPEDILFRFFFLHVSTNASLAKSIKTKGNDDSAAKRRIQEKAGLTEAEFSLVKEVALSCNDAYDAKTCSGCAEVRQLATQNPLKTTPPAAVTARIDALEQERAKVITDCQDSLKRGMGAARYAKLETYVRQSEGATVRYVDPAKPDPRSRTIPLPSLIPTPTGGDPRQGGLK